MELRHLKYFLTLARELNFTKAAEKLCISQPPLSRQIKELEEEIGARLFDRNNKTVTLTDAGKYFEKEAGKLIRNLEAATLKTRKISENISGKYRIAYISSTFSVTISKLIRHLTQLYPYLNIKLYEVPSHKQIAALEQGKIDLGILRAPLISTKITSKRWFQDSYSLVFNNQNIQLNSTREIGKLKDEIFVFFNKDYAPDYHNSLLEICAKYGFTPNIVHESNNINSIIQLVRNGLGVSIVPSCLSKGQRYPEIDYLDLQETGLFTDVLLATPKDSYSEVTGSAVSYLLD
ncbi:LysR family transcriptional regulator [Rapidithrix thailandica]|uniref:LysR family transcriptional regulator n=1 Tax=Rapidithrix thailandica TaxID=413964 RepID=A0AAW9S2U4_9BACT